MNSTTENNGLSSYYETKVSQSYKIKILRYYFQGLTNWGRESMVADLTPDADAIQVVAFIQVSCY